MSQAASLQHSKPADLSRRFEDAWNAYDMDAFGELFHPDATFISRFGHYWRGRQEIVDRHKAIHETIYRDCTIANRVEDVEDIDRHVAVVHVRSLVHAGMYMDRGPKEFGTRFTYVAVRRGHGDWLIQAGANVALVDPETGKQVIELPS